MTPLADVVARGRAVGLPSPRCRRRPLPWLSPVAVLHCPPEWVVLMTVTSVRKQMVGVDILLTINAFFSLSIADASWLGNTASSTTSTAPSSSDSPSQSEVSKSSSSSSSSISSTISSGDGDGFRTSRGLNFASNARWKRARTAPSSSEPSSLSSLFRLPVGAAMLT